MHYLMQFILSGGGTGGQNLPPPVPCSPASSSFISRHPSSAEHFEIDLYRMMPLLTITLTMFALERHMYRLMFLN